MVKTSKTGVVASILVFLVVFCGCSLTNSITMAEGETNDDDVVSCTLSYMEEDNHSVELENGLYSANLGITSFSSVCNDSAGFAIYAVGYSGDTYGNNKMTATINNGLAPDYDIETGTSVSGNTSSWAIKVAPIEGEHAPSIDGGFDEYSEVPDAFTKVASYAASTDDTIGSRLRTSYAVFVSNRQPAGLYEGKVKYTLVHPQDEFPCLEGEICYRANANNVVGKMGKQETTGETAMLWAPNYNHAGYGFAGWNTRADGTGAFYGPNETITLPDDMSEGLILYAKWIKSAGSLQDWAGCSTLNVGDMTALTDERDNNTYAIAKLVDGKCWMIENLRLDYEATRGTANQALAQGYGGVFTGLAEPETDSFADVTTPNSLYTADTTSTTLNVIIGDNLGDRFPRYSNDNTSNMVARMTDVD